jgi:hypothetical protein
MRHSWPRQPRGRRHKPPPNPKAIRGFLLRGRVEAGADFGPAPFACRELARPARVQAVSRCQGRSKTGPPWCSLALQPVPGRVVGRLGLGALGLCGVRLLGLALAAGLADLQVAAGDDGAGPQAVGERRDVHVDRVALGRIGGERRRPSARVRVAGRVGGERPVAGGVMGQVRPPATGAPVVPQLPSCTGAG